MIDVLKKMVSRKESVLVGTESFHWCFKKKDTMSLYFLGTFKNIFDTCSNKKVLFKA